MTLTAECGVTLERLRETLAARGQELPLEGAHAARATLGGTLAANASGPRRFRFGSPRDRILGMRFALADGTLARSGGKVVKNVAGYGIHRLLCGSRGALAAILEASMKVLPGPGMRVALRYEMPASAIAGEARWSAFARLEPAAVSVLGPARARVLGITSQEEALQVFVGLEDEPAWVARQEEAVRRTLGEPASRLEGADVVSLWQSLADLEAREEPQVTFVTAKLSPAALAPVLGTPHAAGLVFHAPAGRLLLELNDDDLSTVDELAGHGFTAIAGAPRPATHRGVLRLRAALRGSLDPAATLAFGERWMRGG
jgi:glycolate oxidase FAD binding subunit